MIDGIDEAESGTRKVMAALLKELKQIPRLDHSEQVWKHVSLVRVLIEPLNRVDTVEIAYRTDWDVEHTVGARFQNWALVELNGSAPTAFASAKLSFGGGAICRTLSCT